MVYQGCTEKAILDNIKIAEKLKEEGNYEGVLKCLDDAQKEIGALFPPRNLAEKIEYLELVTKSYSKLVRLYSSFRVPDYTRRLRDTLINLGTKLELEEVTENKDKNIDSLVKSCIEGLEEYEVDFEKEYSIRVNQELEELKEPVAEMARLMGVSTSESNPKDIEGLGRFLKNIEDKVRNLVR